MSEDRADEIARGIMREPYSDSERRHAIAAALRAYGAQERQRGPAIECKETFGYSGPSDEDERGSSLCEVDWDEAERVARAMTAALGVNPDSVGPATGYANAPMIPAWQHNREWAIRFLAGIAALKSKPESQP